MEKYRSILRKYLPEAAVDKVYDMLREHQAHLKISRKRTSKLGDYRSPHKGNGHQITVNHDLNPYAFLITLVHELAHLLTWERYRNRVRAHGEEWKTAFRELMDPFMEMGIFPPDIRQALQRYLRKSYASSGSDLNLSRALREYDASREPSLEDLEEGSIFRLSNGRTFKKGPRVRKRYRCLCIDNNRIYLVNPLVKVEVAECRA